MDNAFTPGIGSVLDSAVGYIADALEVELLGKVIARLVSCTVHLEGKGDISKTTRGVSGEFPAISD